MRRLATFIIAAFIVGVAIALPAPPDLDPDPLITTTVPEEVIRVARFFHCPWAFADDNNDSSYAFMTGKETDFAVSYPGNGDIELGESGAAPLGSAISIDNDRVLGASAAIVEFSNGPAAASVVAIGEDGLAADVCSSNLPAVWHVAGGSTLENETLSLRLFNPFADDARVNLSAVSELGTEANEAFQSVSVPARTTRTFELDIEFPGREVLSVFIEQLEGSVIPVMVQTTPTDTAMWPGTRHSEVWEFPLVTAGRLSGELVLTNSAPIDVTFSIEIFDDTATVLTGELGIIAGPGQARVSLDDIDTEIFSIRVTGDGPFGATVVGRDDTAFAATVGATTTSNAWLIPGPNAESAASYQLWFLNTGVEPVTITYRKATATGTGLTESITIAAGAVARVDVTDVVTTGIEAVGTSPFSVAWSAESNGRVSFSGAVPIGD